MNQKGLLDVLSATQYLVLRQSHLVVQHVGNMRVVVVHVYVVMKVSIIYTSILDNCHPYQLAEKTDLNILELSDYWRKSTDAAFQCYALFL